MRNRRRRVSTGTSGGIAGQLLGLSLFVMMLAFFIILNAISSLDQTKARPVINSVGATFGARVFDEEVMDSPSVTKNEEKSVNEGNTVERIKALFSSQLPSAKLVVDERRGEMYAKVPYDDFESAVMAVGQGGRMDGASPEAAAFGKFFLPTLVALMKTDATGAPYRMDILVNIAENPAALQNDQPQQFAATINRIGGLAERIERAGLATKLISAGIKKGDPKTVELIFRHHRPYNPLGEGTNGAP